MQLATKTIDAIDEAIRKDQGAMFRKHLGNVIGHIGDAYNPDNFPFRSHLGASVIGDECARKLWYGFRWVKKPVFDGRMIRLFNRGHLEEARFIAMLLTIGAKIYQQTNDGKQFRISAANGHFGGSSDGIIIGIPDLEPNIPALGEFKTSGEKAFVKLKKEGLFFAKQEHYIQMQTYMRKLGVNVGLYMAVNKNTDELHGEIVHLDEVTSDRFIDRGEKIVFSTKAPQKISKTPSWYKCRFCEYQLNCHSGAEPEKNCRTCQYSEPTPAGTWVCNHLKNISPPILTKEAMLQGCKDWLKHKDL